MTETQNQAGKNIRNQYAQDIEGRKDSEVRDLEFKLLILNERLGLGDIPEGVFAIRKKIEQTRKDLFLKTGNEKYNQ